VHGFVPILFLMVVLKIPVGFLLYLVWWSSRAEPLAEEMPPEADDHRFRRFRREPKRPRDPRRGGHGPGAMPLPECPPGRRNRVITAPAPIRAASAHGAQRGSAEPAR
jgi:hypothetical protein